MAAEARFVLTEEIDLSHISIMDRVIAFSVIEDNEGNRLCLLDQSGNVWSYDYQNTNHGEPKQLLPKLPNFGPYTEQVEMVYTQKKTPSATGEEIKWTVYVAGQGQWAVYNNEIDKVQADLKKLKSFALTAASGRYAYVLLPKTDEQMSDQPLSEPIWEADQRGNVRQKSECSIWKMLDHGHKHTFFIHEEWMELKTQPTHRYSQRYVMAVMPSGLLYVVDTWAGQVAGVTANVEEEDVNWDDNPQNLENFRQESQALAGCIDFLGPMDRVVFFKGMMYVFSLEPGNYKLFILQYQKEGFTYG